MAWALSRFSMRIGGESPTHPEDLFLAGAAAERVDPAWEAIDGECHPRVVRGMTARTRGVEAAEEIWAQVIARVAGDDNDAAPLPDGRAPMRIGRFRGRSSLHTFLGVIAGRLIVDEVRARGRLMVHATADTDAVASVEEGGMEQREAADQFVRAFTTASRTLPPRSRALLALVFGQGMQKRAAGVRLGLRDYEVSRELKAALEALRAALHEQDPAAARRHDLVAALRAWADSEAGPVGEDANDE